MSGKWIIIIVIALGIVSLTLNDPGDFRFDLSPPRTNRDARLTEPADRNRDGIISEAERQAELRRIERELERVEKELAEALARERASPYSGQVTLESGGARASDYHDEYVIIRARSNNPAPITVTGWRLESPVTGTRIVIGKAARVPTGNRRRETLSPVVLEPGMEAIVATRAFIGRPSFRTNLCIGYFDQNISIRPRLPRDCPALENENLAAHGITFSAFEEEEDYDQCLDAIERVPRCTRATPRLNFIDEDDEERCEDFIREHTTYESCVALHRNDFDFLGDEWRIFLGKGEELWRNQREIITLLDTSNKVVDVVNY
jgi:hypothetical protein